MAWNKPVEKKVEKVGGKGLIAGLVVVLVGGLVAWLFSGGEKPRADEESRVRTKIAEATPQIGAQTDVRTTASEKAEEEEKAKKPLQPQIAGEIRNGYRLLANGRLHKVYGVQTSRVSRISIAMKTFDHPANQTIAGLLTIEPGDSLLGDSASYYEDFDKHFRDSYSEAIIVKADDSDEVRALKEAVIDTRKELQERSDKGEDIVQVLREAREQMRELGLYREELTKQVETIAGDLDSDLSEKDVKDLVDAANKMLEERGSQPLMLTAPLLYQLREEKLEQEESLQENQ